MNKQAKQIPLTRAALLACAALACGPKAAGTNTDTGGSSGPGPTDASSSSGGGSTSDTSTGTSTGTGTPTSTGAPTGTSDTTPGTNTSATTGDEPHPAKACALVPDPGPCDAAFERYFFNQATQQCEVFVWGGCDGVVPFDDFTACQNACDPCAAFFANNEPPPVFPPVEIEIRNDTADPIFLRRFVADASAYRDERFTVWPEGATKELSIVPNACNFPCSATEYQGCYLYCTEGGPYPPPLMLIPGGAIHTQWGGQHMAVAELPATCLPPQCSELSCGRWLDAAPGLYEIRVAAAATWECENPDCCTPNGDGWCEVAESPDYYFDDYPLELAVPFMFPGGPVLLSFQ